MMEKRKTIPLLCMTFLCGIILFTFAGCRKPTESTSATIPANTMPVLNERQKEILESRNLPVDYDELTVSQQNSILAIEAMLQYAENKYPDETFTFTGEYIPNAEWKPLGGTLTAKCSVGLVSISRTYTHGWEYSDNYAAVKATPEYEQLVGEHLDTLLPEIPFVLIAENLDNLEEGEESLLARTGGSIYVFLYTQMSKEDLLPFVEEYCNWISEEANGHPSTTTFLMARDKITLSMVYPDTIDFLLSENLWVDRIVCSVSDSGSINIR